MSHFRMSYTVLLNVSLSLTWIDRWLSCLQFLLYTCPLSTVCYCAVLPSSPEVFGFVAQHPAAETYHCYLFESKKFVSIPIVAYNPSKRLSLSWGVNTWFDISPVPCAGLSYWGHFPSFKEGGECQKRTRPDCGGTQTQGWCYFASLSELIRHFDFPVLKEKLSTCMHNLWSWF